MLSETMIEASPKTETDETPFRRLNVVKDIICRDCIHVEKIHHWHCMAGGSETNPVTGEKAYVTFCSDKNGAGDCTDFVGIDYDEDSRSQYRQSLKIAGFALLATALLLSALIWLVRSAAT